MSRRTKRTTLTLDLDTLALAERIAAIRGMSLSSLASRAIRNEAIRLGAPTLPTGSEADALQDETERTAIEAEEGDQGRSA